MNDTICAISTGAGGAISIVRMSGEDCFEIVSRVSDICKEKMKANHIVYGHILEDGERVDEAMVSFFRAPRSYSGEDMVEINCHGSLYLTSKILGILMSHGARLAERGEFTSRAYLNGRIDLSQADSINDLIKANNAYKAKSALRGVDGSIERLITPLMDQLKDMISKIEVTIDYPEYEDLEEMSSEIIRPGLLGLIEAGEEMVSKAERFKAIKEGVRTVIIGKPNVGKSSLLNALINQDKAIVTDIAGTTRDLVEGSVSLKNVTLQLIDTAGIRESEDLIEKIGIEKSKEALKEAELVIFVMEGDTPDKEDQRLLRLCEDKERLIVHNKEDLYGEHEGLWISAKEKDISALVEAIEERYKEDASLVKEDILNNERQISLMKSALMKLKGALEDLDMMSVDVISDSLESAYHDLCAILGKEYREDLIDHMFRNFCLGK